ncbi:MAG: glycosyltransferase family 2 protein [Chloroflexota bacterium]
MEKQPAVDIIILNWNARPYLPHCLAALYASTYPHVTVTLVDNQSSDDSLAYVQKHFPQVNIIQAGANLGYAGGNNLGLRQTGAPIAVLLNPDVYVRPDWLAEIIRPFQQNPRTGIVGCKLHYPDGQTLQHAGGYLTPPRALPGHFGLGERDEGQWDKQRQVDYVIGAALALRRQMLNKIGLLDENFFLYFEDVDLCYRARAAGYGVVYEPAAAAVHVESATTIKNSPAYLRRFHTGRWRFLLKHYPVDRLLSETIPAEKRWLAQLPPPQRRYVEVAYRQALRQWPAIGKQYPGKSEQDAVRYEGTLMEQLSSEEIQHEVAAGLLDLQAGAADLLAGEDPLTWEVVERPFASTIPLIGPLVARFRTAWNNVSTKWYVRGLLQQQNGINRQLVTRLQFMDERLVAQDQAHSQLIYDVAELNVQLAQMNRLLQSLDERLTRLEEQ